MMASLSLVKRVFLTTTFDDGFGEAGERLLDGACRNGGECRNGLVGPTVRLIKRTSGHWVFTKLGDGSREVGVDGVGFARSLRSQPDQQAGSIEVGRAGRFPGSCPSHPVLTTGR